MSEILTVPDTAVARNTKIYGLDESILRAKYPKSGNITLLTSEPTPGILGLAKAPIGSGHDNFLNGIVVQFDLTLTNKAWVEAERYHFLDFVSSESTMHSLAKFDLEDRYDKYVDPRCIEIMKELIARYNETKDLKDYYRCLMSNPCGFKITAGMTTNYRQLRTIYHQRRAHLLPEWRAVCNWIETLPMADDLITAEPKSFYKKAKRAQ